MEISHCLPYKLPVIAGVQVFCLHNASTSLNTTGSQNFYTVGGLAKWFQGLIELNNGAYAGKHTHNS